MEKQNTDELEQLISNLREKINKSKQKSIELSNRINQQEYTHFKQPEINIVQQEDKSQLSYKYEFDLLQTKFNALLKEKEDLELKYKQLISDIELLETKLNSLTKEKQDIETKHKELLKKFQEISNKNSQEEIKITQLNNEIKKLKEQIKGIYVTNYIYEFISESIRFFRIPYGMVKEIISIVKENSNISNNIKNKIDILEQELRKLINTVVEAQNKYNFPKELSFKPVELNSFSNVIIEKFSSKCSDSKINLIYKTSLENIYVLVDINLFLDAIEQVIINSIEALPDGGNIEISTYVFQQKAILQIQDTGTGIPPHLLDKVFKPFFTTKQNHTGLGLSRVFWIMKLHCADIVVESIFTKGTTVKLILEKTE